MKTTQKKVRVYTAKYALTGVPELFYDLNVSSEKLHYQANT